MTQGVLTVESFAALPAAVGSHGQSAAVQITQAMIDAFADITGDPQWIHIDVERAKRESPFGAPVAHGFLTLSMLSNLIGTAIRMPQAKQSINYGFEKVRFVAPVRAGTYIAARFRLDDAKTADAYVQYMWNVTVTGGETADAATAAEAPVALVAQWLGRAYF